MNTEINFLEKKHKKSAATLMLGVLLMTLLVLMVAIFFYQKIPYQTEINQRQEVLSEIESALIDHQTEHTGGVEIQQLKQDIAELEADLPKNLSLYKKVIGFLAAPDQLVSYDSTGQHSLVLNAQFAGLDQVAEYISTLGNQLYINDIQLTSVTKTGESYLATLTISPDTQALGKEFAEND